MAEFSGLPEVGVTTHEDGYVFEPYETPIWSNSATRDLEQLIPRMEIDDRLLVSKAIARINSPTGNIPFPTAQGLVAEVAVKMALDQIMAEDSRYRRFDDEFINGDRRLERVSDSLLSYMYRERGVRNSQKEYDGILMVQDASGAYIPVVLEVKASRHADFKGGLNRAMQPGRVESKLAPLIKLFDQPMGYGVIARPKRVTDKSPLQSHFRKYGGFVAPLPISGKKLSTIAELVSNFRS